MLCSPIWRGHCFWISFLSSFNEGVLSSFQGMTNNLVEPHQCHLMWKPNLIRSWSVFTLPSCLPFSDDVSVSLGFFILLVFYCSLIFDFLDSNLFWSFLHFTFCVFNQFLLVSQIFLFGYGSNWFLDFLFISILLQIFSHIEDLCLVNKRVQASGISLK